MLCVIKDCGAEGEGLLSFPRAGHLDRPRHPGARRHAGARRRAQRARDRRRRAHLPGQGRLHARRALPGHGAATAGLDGRAPALGSGGAHPQRPVGPPASETPREGRLPRRHQGDGPRPGPPHGAARRSPLPARPRRRRPGSAARATSRCADERPSASAPCDLEKPESFAPALDAAETALGGLDTVVVTAGLFATQDQLEADPALAHRLLLVDFTNTVAFCEEARRRLLARGGGTLCVFSSVAGERGRKPVVLYGAAKAGLTPLPRGARSPLPRGRAAHGLRQARLRADVDDRRLAGAALRRRAGGRGATRARGHRRRHARRLRPGGLGLGHVRDPPAAALRHAPRPASSAAA